MLRNVLACFFIFLGFTATSQVITPGKLEPEKISKTIRVGDVVDLVFNATIDDNWYMYSVGFEDCGPIPMSVTLEKNASFELVGSLVGVNHKVKHDKTFGCDVFIFVGKGKFIQKIKVLSTDLVLKGSYEGQVCTDVDGRCVPIGKDIDFGTIKVEGKAVKSDVKKTIEEPTKSADVASNNSLATDTTKARNVKTNNASWGEIEGPVLDKSILSDEGTVQQEESLLSYMLVAFILGLTSLITPCVFPMIPMTVTFFLKDNQSKREGVRKALIFGTSIIVIYTVAGTIFALLFGADGLNAMATHWLPNLLIFVLFIVFALSFLGMFEITAPHQLVNKADQAAERGGLAGVFFMSATLVLVSFSCTIPIVGNVLVLAAGGKFVTPIVGMLAYSAAFAIPFTLFAIFPEWMKSLPKSGGWLNTVKVTLGLVELALSLKFLSIVDQTYHWGILDRDINIAIWIVIFAVLGFYFLGKLRMSSDSPVEKLGVGRLMLALATLSFVVYLIPGLWGAPLKALAGYLPPMHTHDFDLISISRGDNPNASCEEPKHKDILHLPHNLNGYFDYKQALACARKQGKPVFIDFTGHGCVNCREMEAVVWSDPRVLNRLSNDFVVVALYVDDKTELPESEWYTSTKDNKVKKTIGKQNADLQISRLDNNAQPFYVIVGPDEKVLVTPVAYNRRVTKFIEFLDAGVKKYKERYSD